MAEDYPRTVPATPTEPRLPVRYTGGEQALEATPDTGGYRISLDLKRGMLELFPDGASRGTAQRYSQPIEQYASQPEQTRDTTVRYAADGTRIVSELPPGFAVQGTGRGNSHAPSRTAGVPNRVAPPNWSVPGNRQTSQQDQNDGLAAKRPARIISLGRRGAGKPEILKKKNLLKIAAVVGALALSTATVLHFTGEQKPAKTTATSESTKTDSQALNLVIAEGVGVKSPGNFESLTDEKIVVIDADTTAHLKWTFNPASKLPKISGDKDDAKWNAKFQAVPFTYVVSVPVDLDPKSKTSAMTIKDNGEGKPKTVTFDLAKVQERFDVDMAKLTSGKNFFIPTMFSADATYTPEDIAAMQQPGVGVLPIKPENAYTFEDHIKNIWSKNQLSIANQMVAKTLESFTNGKLKNDRISILQRALIKAYSLTPDKYTVAFTGLDKKMTTAQDYLKAAKVDMTYGEVVDGPSDQKDAAGKPILIEPEITYKLEIPPDQPKPSTAPSSSSSTPTTAPKS